MQTKSDGKDLRDKLLQFNLLCGTRALQGTKIAITAFAQSRDVFFSIKLTVSDTLVLDIIGMKTFVDDLYLNPA